MPFCYNDIGHPSRVTENRIDLALKFTCRGDNYYCVFSAGYSKENPTIPNAKRSISLADQMAKYLLDKEPCVNVYHQPLGWGTLSEMIWAIRIAKGKWGFGPGTKVVFVSSFDHMTRIEKYARWIMPKDWDVYYDQTAHFLHEDHREKMKYWKDLPYLIWLSAKTRLGFRL